MEKIEKIRAEKYNREIEVREITNDRIIKVAFSSETPVRRWYGWEILGHDKQNDKIRLERLNDKAAFLINHDPDKHIGVIESAYIDDDRIGRAIIRLGNSELANEIYRDIQDGIKTKISVGYVVNELVLVSEDDGVATYRITDWEPVEISIVSVPADYKVGINRSLTNNKKGDLKMENKVIENEELILKERQRINDIESLAKKVSDRVNNVDDLVKKAVNEGMTIEQFRGLVIENLKDSGPFNLAVSGNIGMSEKEVKKYSIVRAIMSQVPGYKGDAAFEREVSDEISRRVGRKAQGIFVPDDVFTRDLVVATATAGGYFVEEDRPPSLFIELLRNKMFVTKLGARLLSGLVGNVGIPRQTAAATAYWVTEGNAPTESQQTLGQILLSPKTVGAFTDISRQLLLQSNIDVENFVKEDLAKILAIAIDAAAIQGSGSSGQPTGIINTSGVATASNASIAWSHILTHESNIATANADIDELAFLTTPAVRAILKGRAKVSGYPSFIWENDEINGYKAYATNQVPSATLIFGLWSSVLIGEWGGLDILVDPYTGGTAGNLRIVAFKSIDVGIRYPAGFSIGTSVS